MICKRMVSALRVLVSPISKERIFMGTLARMSAAMVFAFCLTCRVVAATPVDTLRVDLNPLLDSAARSQEQFAVNIHRAVSSASQGIWTQKGSLSTWVYTVRVPTAISMSFHGSVNVITHQLDARCRDVVPRRS